MVVNARPVRRRLSDRVVQTAIIAPSNFAPARGLCFPLVFFRGDLFLQARFLMLSSVQDII